MQLNLNLLYFAPENQKIRDEVWTPFGIRKDL